MRKLLIVGLLLAAACSRSSKVVEPAERPDLALLELVPADAEGVVLLEPPGRLLELLGGVLSEPRRKAFEDDVVAYVQTRQGIDVRKVQRVALFVTPSNQTVVVVPNVPSPPHDSRPRLLGVVGEQVTVARENDVLFIGDFGAIQAALEVARRKQPSFASLPNVASLARERRDAWLTLFVGRRALAAVPGGTGLTIGMVTIGDQGLRGVALGDDAAVTAAADALRGGVALLRQEARRNFEEMKARDDDVSGLAAIMLGHYSDDAFDLLKVRGEKGRLLVELDPRSMMIGLGTIGAVGVMAAIAIPAFMKSARTVKRPEAVTNLRRAYEGARLYAEDQRARGLRPSFPAKSVGPTPPLPTCCAAPNHKCQPNPALWTDPSWKALKFSMDDPHYYSYTYESNGSSFTVRANGDLDCDGVYSTFEMVGTIEPDGTINDTAPGIFKDQELE